VNTFENPEREGGSLRPANLMRASDEEKRAQLDSLREFRARNRDRAPDALRRLQDVARRGENIFAELMKTVKVASLGQITDALFEVGGRYRRSM
jgi:methylmalonyl-CoA mutase